MAEKLVIELVDEVHEAVFDENIETDSRSVDEAKTVSITRHFRWGYIDELSNWPGDSHSGSEDDLLLSLSNHQQPALLLIPGHKVVGLSVDYNKKEARHFLKLLPYQIEDDVLGSVDNLHFAVSRNKEADKVVVAYADFEWLESLLTWMRVSGIKVENCIANYQILHASDNELLIWFTDGRVVGHRSNGLGFSIAQSLSQAFLKDILRNQHESAEPISVRVFVDDAETQEIIESHIMPPVEYDVLIGQPPLSFSQESQLNFCNGRFGKKLPLDQWWKELKPVAMLAAASVVVFFVATFADIYMIKQQQSAYKEDMVTAFRTVVPRGAASDPVRRLKGMLGNNTEAEPSQVVFLLSKVAPVLDKLEINITTLNYSNRERALRVNIQAKSFNGVEQFRQQLSQQGINAELQSSNAAAEGFQARLRIGLEG